MRVISKLIVHEYQPSCALPTAYHPLVERAIQLNTNLKSLHHLKHNLKRPSKRTDGGVGLSRIRPPLCAVLPRRRSESSGSLRRALCRGSSTCFSGRRAREEGSSAAPDIGRGVCQASLLAWVCAVLDGVQKTQTCRIIEYESHNHRSTPLTIHHESLKTQ